MRHEKVKRFALDFLAEGPESDFRSPDLGSFKVHKAICSHVEQLYVEHPLYNSHNTMKKLVQSVEVSSEVEKVVGEMG